MRGWTYALATVVEVRSYSRISGATSWESETITSGKRSEQAPADGVLMGTVRERVEQHDRPGSTPRDRTRVEDGVEPRDVEWLHDGSLGIEPLFDLEAAVAGTKGSGSWISRS